MGCSNITWVLEKKWWLDVPNNKGNSFKDNQGWTKVRWVWKGWNGMELVKWEMAEKLMKEECEHDREWGGWTIWSLPLFSGFVQGVLFLKSISTLGKEINFEWNCIAWGLAMWNKFSGYRR